MSLSKFYGWRARYGKVNEHNAQVPREHWLEDWEKQAIVAYERQHPLEGYRRLTFMMLDDDVVAASPPTVYPQSNGKKERCYETLKSECIRPNTPLSLEDARRLVARFVEHYNHARLHSAIGYVTPADKLFGLENVIHRERDRKLETAREERRQRRQAARQVEKPQQPARQEADLPHHDTSLPRAWLDFRSLRQSVTMEQVLRHLGYFDALRGFGPQRRGPCPLHDQPDGRFRSFSVNLAKNLFQCFHPPCRAAGNALDLWAAAHRLPLAEAAQHMAATFHVPLTAKPTPQSEKRNPYPNPCHPLTLNALLSTSR